MSVGWRVRMVRFPLSRVLGDLRGRSGRRFVSLLVGHIETTFEGANLAMQAAIGDLG